MAIASSLCGLAQGKGGWPARWKAWLAIRAPPKAIQLAMLIGLAFIRSLALYTLLIVFLKVS